MELETGNDYVQKSVSAYYGFYTYHDSKFICSTKMAVGDTDFCATTCYI
jgi:hypothetical protein